MRKSCQWLLHPDDPDPARRKETCGKRATAQVTVKTKITTAVVDLCGRHKQEHNVLFAKLRTHQDPSTDHPTLVGGNL